MSDRRCRACHGERGCPDCSKAVGRVSYESLTVFSKEYVPSSTNQRDNLFLAADLGTTTLAFLCVDKDGTELSSLGMENPQKTTSSDVVSRMDYALRDKENKLTKLIKEALVKGFLFVLSNAEKEREKQNSSIEIAIAGNTVMQHILLSYPLLGLSRAPFLPYRKDGITLPFSELFGEFSEEKQFPQNLRNATVTIFPCASGFVGGDAVAGAYFLDLTEKKGSSLLIDLGTNGEMVLSRNGALFATAAAMGSAFEGGSFPYASELFSHLAKARQKKVLSEEGLLSEPYFTDGFEGMTEEDVREFQLAKAAIRTGIELLCKKAGVTTGEVREIFLSGGGSRYIKEENLYLTGILPTEFSGKVKYVGNSCIGGLTRFLLTKKRPEGLFWEVLNLAEQPDFEPFYYRFLNFEPLTQSRNTEAAP